MNFYVDSEQGHDDFLMSTALMVAAAELWEPREAKGKYPSPILACREHHEE